MTVTAIVSTKFNLNDRVKTNAALNVRATPSTGGILLGTQPINSLGTITGGPTFADSYWWWNVNYDSGADGWSVEDYLDKANNPTPTPTPGGDATFRNLTVTGSLHSPVAGADSWFPYTDGNTYVRGSLNTNSDIYFNNILHNHTGFGNTAGYAAIENAKDYNTLMILGRSGGIGGVRSVSVWDRLDVNGTLNATGNIGSNTGFCIGSNCITSWPGGGGGSFTNTAPANYLTKSVSASSIGQSLVYDNGTNVGIGITNPNFKLDVNGQINASTGLCMSGVCKTTWPSGGGGGEPNTVRISDLATGGTGTQASPWIGWDTRIGVLAPEIDYVFPCGWYSFSNTINMTKTPGRYTLRGTSKQCVTLIYTGTGDAILVDSLSSPEGNYKNILEDIEIHDFTLWSNTGNRGIHLREVGNVVIKDIKIRGYATGGGGQGWKDAGIVLGGTSPCCGTIVTRITDSEITYGNGDGIKTEEQNTNHAISITNSHIQGNWGVGINIAGSGNGWNIVGNTLEGNGQGSIVLSYTEGGLNISGNYFEETAAQSTSITIGTQAYSYGISITGNSFAGDGLTNTAIILGKVAVTEGGVVSGNAIFGYKTCIQQVRVVDYTIANNKCRPF